MGPKDVLIVFSQSGETADVLEVLEKVKPQGIKLASFVNMPGSMITRMSDYKFMAQAGAEFCVLSTKIFVSQMAFGYLLAKAVAGCLEKGKSEVTRAKAVIGDLLKRSTKPIEDLAEVLKDKKDIFILGKGENLAVAREGMVKLVEATYKHVHAIPAGDLKHYAITIVEKGVPVMVIVPEGESKNDLLMAADEVKSRGATVIGVAETKAESFDFQMQVPSSGETAALVNIIPFQLLAYFLGLKLGHNIDRPRNIAKSVTVK
jgi:glucosamine--fructose-6-phosphate aminotransferase (isomerizing)